MRSASLVVAVVVAIGAAVIASLPLGAGERAKDPLTVEALGHLADAIHARSLRDFESVRGGLGVGRGTLWRLAIENRCGLPRRDPSKPVTDVWERLSVAFMLEERDIQELLYANNRSNNGVIDGPGAPADTTTRAGRGYLRFAGAFREAEALFRSGDGPGGMAKIDAALEAEVADK